MQKHFVLLLTLSIREIPSVAAGVHRTPHFSSLLPRKGITADSIFYFFSSFFANRKQIRTHLPQAFVCVI